MCKIWDIELRKEEIVEDNMGNKYVRGDIYSDGECIGYYNPVEQVGDGMPMLFVKLKDERVREKYSDYKSIYDYPGMEKYVDDVNVIPRGLNVLLEDLGRLIMLEKRMNDVYDGAVRVIGVINDNVMQVIPFTKEPVGEDGNPMSKEELVDFIEGKMGKCYDSNYPVLVFENEDDFVFKKGVGV